MLQLARFCICKGKPRELKHALLSTPPQHENPQDGHGHREADGRFVLPILTIQLPGKSLRRRRRGRKPRPKHRDPRHVLHKCSVILPLEFALFPPNYHRIKNREIGGQQQRGNPRMAGHGKSGGKKHASEVQRIPCECIRARGRQLLVLAKVSRGITANEQPANGNSRSPEEPLHLRPGEPEGRDADRISHGHTPADPKICLGVQ